MAHMGKDECDKVVKDNTRKQSGINGHEFWKSEVTLADRAKGKAIGSTEGEARGKAIAKAKESRKK